MTRLISIEPRRSLKDLSLRLWIVDYFDDLVNNIDVYAETCLLTRGVSDEQRNDVLLTRRKFLQAIENSQCKNLNVFEESLDKIDKFVYNDLLNGDDERFFQSDDKIDIVKKRLFESYCCLLVDTACKKCFKLKLATFDWYVDEYQRNILRFELDRPCFL